MIARPSNDSVEDAPQAATENAVAEPSMIDDELLVEDVSIDGLCGVY